MESNGYGDVRSVITPGVEGGPVAFRQVLDNDTNMKSDLLLHLFSLGDQ